MSKVDSKVYCIWAYIKGVSEPQKSFQAPKYAFENFDFPIVGSKTKVVVESSVTYENLSVEKYKTNGKRISTIRLYLVKEKSQISLYGISITCKRWILITCRRRII